VIQFQSEIVGKEAVYGEIKEPFEREGFTLGGNWDYGEAFFDAILEREKGETIYLRLPVHVVEGQLDDRDSRLSFEQPLLLRHVVHTGIDKDENLLALGAMPLTSSLMGQFQEPAVPDGEIHEQNLRLEKASQAIKRIMHYLH
jgi:hypothetical protein